MKVVVNVTLALVSCWLTSCSTLLRNAVNRKYPPVFTIDKKIKSVCVALNDLDTSKIYDANISVAKSLVDTISKFELKKTNGSFVISQAKILDSLKIKHLDASFAPQEVTILSRQNIFLSNKKIKAVDFEVTASLSPYYTNDTLYFNPYFDRIHLHKIFFRKCGFLSRYRPLITLLNGIFDKYLANLNGQVKNYFVIIKPLPEGGEKISEILSREPNVVVEQDATIKWQTHNYISSIYITETSMNFLLANKINNCTQQNSICDNYSTSSISAKQELFNNLYLALQQNHNYLLRKSFDPTPENSVYLTRVILSNTFLQDNLNYAFNNINFKFRYPLNFNGAIPRTDVDIQKPDISCNCDDYCNTYIRGNGYLRKKAFEFCKLTCPRFPNPVNFYPNTVYPMWPLCKSMQAILSPFGGNITIGSINGDFTTKNTIRGNFKSIKFYNFLKSVDIDKELFDESNIDYHFKFESLNQISLGRLLFFFATGGCEQFNINDNLNLTGSLTPDVLSLKITKEQLNEFSNVKIEVAPVTIGIKFDHPPGDALVTNWANWITCPFGAKLGVLTIVLGRIVPERFIPNKFRDAFNIVTRGKYDHTFEIKSLTIPLHFQAKAPALTNIDANSKWGDKSIEIYTKFQ